MKRIFLLCSIFVALFTVFPVQRVSALTPAEQKNWVDNDYADCMDKTLDAKDQRICSGAYFSMGQTSYLSDGVRRIAGAVPGITTNSTNKAYLQKMRDQSAIGATSNIIATIYANPPASTYAFVKDMGQTLGFIPKSAYAQGVGFSGLAPLLPIWKIFRNIAYVVLAIIMVVIGFMIMFRQKIDPKTVVTVQNALPRVIVTLLLITFSYAIVGILIDAMYLVLSLIVSLLVSAGKGVLDPNTLASYYSGGFGTVLHGVFKGAWFSTDDIVTFLGVGGTAGTAVGAAGVGAALGAILLSGGTAAIITGFIAPVLLVFLLVVLLFFAVLRILFALMGAYIQIIIALLMGPIQLLLGALPGNDAFGSWIKGLVSNLVVFPVTAALLLIASLLGSLETWWGSDQSMWAPPIIGGTGHGLGGIIALGILLTIPSILNNLKEAFKTKPMIQPGGIGQVGGILSTGGQMAFQYWSGKRQVGEMARQQQKWMNPTANEMPAVKK